jgi:hypothetical protein
LALNSYFIGIDIFIYSIYPVWDIACVYDVQES